MMLLFVVLPMFAVAFEIISMPITHRFVLDGRQIWGDSMPNFPHLMTHRALLLEDSQSPGNIAIQFQHILLLRNDFGTV